MKKISNISALIGGVILAGGMALSGCTDSFENWNTDPNRVPAELLEQDNLKTGALFSQMVRGVMPVGQDKGGTFQIHQMLNGDNFAGYVANIKSAYDGVSTHHDHYRFYEKWCAIPFNDTYPSIMEPWRQIVENTIESSLDRAMATVVKVLAMQRITDKYGPIPYSLFGTAINVPYDSQEAVYNRFFEELDAALAVINDFNTKSSKPYMKDYDYVYNGDVKRWAKLANTLRLRLAMRISYAAPEKAKAEIEKALNDAAGFLTSKTDDAYVQNSGSFTYTNPLYEVGQSFNDMRMSATIECYLKGYNDPRLDAYFEPAKDNGEYHGVRNGISSRFDSYLDATSYQKFAATDAVCWMKASEAYFLLAEAKLRFGLGNDDVQTLYEKGVSASFESLGVRGAANYLANSENTPLQKWYNVATSRDIDVSGMVSTLPVAWDESATAEKKLERLMTQKWLALYPDGVEAWSEMRRTGYPGWVRIESYNSASGVTSNDMIRRIKFPDTEYSNNGANVQAAVTLLGGADNGGTHLWWDCK